ncbi:MAG: DUF4388 domain-containing protein [Candidatus Melainabacteria bacterium]|nr:DUF4388 domain-containing protein [Candidatus Melainabacteria bacterium]
MIEGSLADISLPGLLQLLADESGSSYHIHIRRSGQSCDLTIVRGRLRVAKFGILEGHDALTEVVSWGDGTFKIETLPRDYVLSAKPNLDHRLDQPGTFTDQFAFLRQVNVGLNTEIVPSTNFGTEEWQAALRVQPLGKYDYQVLGWITDGRTMHQAMVELELDLRMAVGMLFRLVVTGSVEVVRPGNIDPGEYRAKLKELVSTKLRELAEFRFGPEGARDLEIENTIPPTNGTKSSAERQAEIDATWDQPEEKKTGTDTQELPTVPASLVETAPPKKKRERVDTEGSLPEQAPVPASPMVSANDHESKSESSGSFDLRRTDPLPLVSIDIERLLNTIFKVTEEGKEALEAGSVDAMVKEVLTEVERAKTLLLVLTDSNRTEAAILATYRYALEKGLIMHHDSVMELTIQLLLNKLSIEEYLLQRRRISTDQLQELQAISQRQGIGLHKLLIGTGCLLPADLDRLKQERERFAPE